MGLLKKEEGKRVGGGKKALKPKVKLKLGLVFHNCMKY
jgi:hypothetical protein